MAVPKGLVKAEREGFGVLITIDSLNPAIGRANLAWSHDFSPKNICLMR
jgi:hypothetical protein